MLPRLEDSNGLTLVKIKRDLSYPGHVIFESMRHTVVYEAIRFLKDHNKLYCNVLMSEE